MEKRTILAIVLSIGILFIYSSFVSRRYPVVNKGDMTSEAVYAPQRASQQPVAQIAPSYPAPTDVGSITPKQEIVFETEKLNIVFVNPGAYIKTVELKDYNEQLFLENLFLVDGEAALDFKVQQEPGAIIFTHRSSNQEIIKRFSVSNTLYTIELERKVRNINSPGVIQNYRLLLASKINKKNAYENRFMELVIDQPDKAFRKRLPGLKPRIFPHTDFNWVGMRDRYFSLIIAMPQGAKNVFSAQAGEEQQVGLEITPATTTYLDTDSYSDKFIIYLGPQKAEILSTLNLGFEKIVYFGFFNLISQFLLSVLKFFFSFTHNWGVAILMFGVFIFLILYPLSAKQIRSMKEMQILQPKIKELQARLKGDAQRLNKEMMLLYKEHKVNPLGGCLPLLFQMPIFFSLYAGLMRFISLRGAQFLWIKDLSQPDRLIPLAQKYPIIGDGINILPLLMMGSMFAQQKFSSAAMSAGSSSEQQKMMLIMMPLLFGFIFYRMPSGLVLYWLVYGTLTGLNQWFNSRKRVT